MVDDWRWRKRCTWTGSICTQLEWTELVDQSAEIDLWLVIPIPVHKLHFLNSLVRSSVSTCNVYSNNRINIPLKGEQEVSWLSLSFGWILFSSLWEVVALLHSLYSLLAPFLSMRPTLYYLLDASIMITTCHLNLLSKIFRLVWLEVHVKKEFVDHSTSSLF